MFGCAVFRVVHRNGGSYDERCFFVLTRAYGSPLTTPLTTNWPVASARALNSTLIQNAKHYHRRKGLSARTAADYTEYWRVCDYWIWYLNRTQIDINDTALNTNIIRLHFEDFCYSKATQKSSSPRNLLLRSKCPQTFTKQQWWYL